MEANISSRTILQEIPSASGLEADIELLYVIGDDSPYLYLLDRQYRLLTRQELFPSADFATGRIPKDKKPDLEALTRLELEGKSCLFAIGSGSGPAREKGYLIPLPTALGSTGTVREIDLHAFYETLRSSKAVTGGSPLNLEGMAASETHLILLQRGVGNSPNAVIRYPLSDFTAYLKGHRPELPPPQVDTFRLPTVKGIVSGFSGAHWFDGRLFFTASVEDTQHPVLDGEVHGSCAGVIDFRQDPPRLQAARLQEDGRPAFRGKAEAIVVLEKQPDGSYRALALTDNDQGQSELLELALRLEDDGK